MIHHHPQTTRPKFRLRPLIALLALSATALTACSSDQSLTKSDTANSAVAEVVETTSSPDLTAAGTDTGAADTTIPSVVETNSASTETTVPFDVTMLPKGAASKVVASTSWVAAVAKLAGAKNISVLAPNSVIHPPDYDPKPSDLATLADADLVLLAGFEGFAKRMTEAVGSTARISSVALMFDPAILGPEVMDFAAILGTTDVATSNLAAYTAAYTSAAEELKAKLGGSSQVVVSHAFVAEWAGFAGWTTAGTFGPKPLTAGDIAALSGMKPTVVLENSHMPGGEPIADATGAKFISLVNFPGDDLDLASVVKKNADAIAEALAS